MGHDFSNRPFLRCRRLRQVLATNAISIQAYDQDIWAKTFNYARRDPRESLANFHTLREANVALLKSVPRKLWENYGVHAERGNESVNHVVKMVAGHDLNHLLRRVSCFPVFPFSSAASFMGAACCERKGSLPWL
jgi:hypothetical protein